MPYSSWLKFLNLYFRHLMNCDTEKWSLCPECPHIARVQWAEEANVLSFPRNALSTFREIEFIFYFMTTPQNFVGTENKSLGYHLRNVQSPHLLLDLLPKSKLCGCLGIWQYTCEFQVTREIQQLPRFCFQWLVSNRVPPPQWPVRIVWCKN